MHLKLQQGVSDVTGETGMAMSRAILAGERAPVQLAHLRTDRCQQDEATMAKALHGHWREEHRLALAHAVARYDTYHQQLSACDRQSAAPLATCAERRASEA